MKQKPRRQALSSNRRQRATQTQPTWIIFKELISMDYSFLLVFLWTLENEQVNSQMQDISGISSKLNDPLPFVK